MYGRYPVASQPPKAALLDFLEQCERERIDGKALEKLQKMLEKMHAKGVTIDREVKKAFKQLKAPRSKIPARAPEPALSWGSFETIAGDSDSDSSDDDLFGAKYLNKYSNTAKLY